MNQTPKKITPADLKVGESYWQDMGDRTNVYTIVGMDLGLQYKNAVEGEIHESTKRLFCRAIDGVVEL